MFQPDLLKGKRILVTGGGTGLGRSMAHRYLELGANVIICGRREEVLKETAAELAKETGGEIETVGCDVRIPDAVEAMMDKIWEKRPLDILVNNAAGQILAQTHKMSSRAIDAGAGHRAARLGLLHRRGRPPLDRCRRAQQGGDVDPHRLVADRRALHRAVGHGQGGRAGHDQEPGRRMGPQGHPHLRDRARPFPTEGAWSRLMPKERGGNDDMIKAIPMRRTGEHIELANLAAFLVSDGAAYINGDADRDRRRQDAAVGRRRRQHLRRCSTGPTSSGTRYAQKKK